MSRKRVGGNPVNSSVKEATHAAQNRWDDRMKGWVINSYADCLFVETREDIFPVLHSNFPAASIIRGSRGIQLLEGEEHRRVHAFLARYFSVERIDEWRAKVVRPLVRRQLQEFVPTGQLEIAAEFADPLPVRVIASILGIPPYDTDFVRSYVAWNDAITPWVETRGQVSAFRETAEKAAIEFSARILPIVKARKRHPHNDLISLLWKVGPSLLRDWDETAILDQIQILFMAGGEGIAQLICSVAYTLLTELEVQNHALENLSVGLPQITEEVLRLYPPAQLRPRAATQDIAMQGIVVKKGDVVYPNVEAANRDPEYYKNPLKIDPERLFTVRHLAFNMGPRFCVGAALARAIASESLSILFSQLKHMRLNTEAESPHLVGFRFRGFRPLHVLFERT